MAVIGLAAMVIARRDSDAVIGAFAADHMISGDDAFLSAVTEAVAVVKKDYLVTIGIAPPHLSTGFGYVRLGESLRLTEDAPNARKVSNFKEKPDACTAAAYIKTGNYHWNARMFVMKASFLLPLLSESKPGPKSAKNSPETKTTEPRPGIPLDGNRSPQVPTLTFGRQPNRISCSGPSSLDGPAPPCLHLQPLKESVVTGQQQAVQHSDSV